MIEAALGLPGAGKSLWCVGHRIIPALKEGRLVVTNVPLIMRGLRIECGNFIDPWLVELKKDDLGREPFSDVEDFTKYSGWRKEGDKGQGPLFVIDECHVALADCVGLQAGKNPIVAWFAEHRHTGSDVVLMTQLEKGIPSAIRGRVELFYKFIRKGFMGADNKFRMNVYDTQGVKMPVHEDGEYNKAWFKCYRSHVPGASEERAARPSIWSAWQFKMIGVLAALMIGWLVYNGGVSIPGVSAPKAPKAVSAGADALSAAAASASSGASASSPSNAALIADLDNRILLKQKERQLAQLEAGCDIGSAPSGLVGGFVGMPGKSDEVCGGQVKAYRHEFDQYRVKIVGHTRADARSVYWLELWRNGRGRVERDDNLQPFGFELTAVNPCLAFLKGEHGVYRVTCDGFNLIGAAEDAAEKSKITLSSSADAGLEEKIPANGF
jgi:zona occludens toxin